jgi:hypothetical protein
VLVGESPLSVSILQHRMGDLAALAEMRATMEDVCNAFQTPISYMTTNVNLANLQASNMRHIGLCIGPRVTRRDQKLNEQLLPIYNDSGRLSIASEDPCPATHRPCSPKSKWTCNTASSLSTSAATN